MKKIISLILAVFVLTAVFSFEAFADSTSIKVYNSPDGTASQSTPTSDDVLDKYEDVRYYKVTEETDKGTDSNQNEKNSAALRVGYNEAQGNWVSFMRFPLTGIPENEIPSSVYLNITFNAGYDFSSADAVLNVYGDFTEAEFGKNITYSKTFDEITGQNVVGNVTLSEAYTKNTTFKIDITEYIKSCIQNDAASADIALAMPGAETLVAFYGIGNTQIGQNAAMYKPHITLTTIPYISENGGEISVTGSLADGISSELFFEKEGYYYITTTGYGNGGANAKISFNDVSTAENILHQDELGQYVVGTAFMVNEGINDMEILLMDDSYTDAQITKIAFKPNQSPVFEKGELSNLRPLLGEELSLTASAVDPESDMDKISYKIIPEGADESNISETEMILNNGEYKANFSLTSTGKYSVKLFAYDNCGAVCEKTLFVNCVDVKAENAQVTEETVSDGVKIIGQLDFSNSSATDKEVALIIAVYDENNRMIAQKNAVSTVSAGTQQLSVDTTFEPPATGNWTAELILWDSLLDMNSLTDITKYN